MSARRTRAPWSDKSSTSKQRSRPVQAVEPVLASPASPARPSLGTRYPIGQRDARLLGALAVLLVGAAVAWTVSSGGENAELKASLDPFQAAARRAFPGDDDKLALKKLTARVEELYPAPGAAGPRGVSAAQRAALISTLRAETGPVKKVWFSVQSNNAEAVTFQKWLAQAFEEAGWQVEVAPWPSGSLKQGVFFFAAEEKSDAYVDTAQRALEAAGIKANVAIGYRAFYKDKKKENPAWPGVDMKGDQAYAIVIGPKEEAAAAAP